MTRLITISLLIIYLLGETDLGQILNSPKLIVHYHQHAKINSGISFVNFIIMHYAGDDGTTQDDQQDHELPFKSAHKPFLIITNGIPSVVNSVSYLLSSTPVVKNCIIVNNTILYGYLSEQIHPPQFQEI